MEVNHYDVEIKEEFYNSSEEIYQFILSNSYQSAQKFRKEIVELIALICERPSSFNIGRIANSGKVFRYAKIIECSFM